MNIIFHSPHNFKHDARDIKPRLEGDSVAGYCPISSVSSGQECPELVFKKPVLMTGFLN